MATRIKDFEKIVPMILALPRDTFFDCSQYDNVVSLSMQASGKEVSRVRSAFPGVIWTKTKSDDFGWWEYDGKFDGVKIHIYADRLGPESCTRIEEKITSVVHVPACEAHDEEKTKIVVRWICKDDPEEDKSVQSETP